MDPNLHHAPLHWGYPSTPPQNPWVPPQTRAAKRALSESDCEELYSEESSKEQTSPGESSSCQLLSRKKRRGVIEKKRRDRINSSLSELKRLVPSAYEKQGSAKLEKAEILQLTVEHLKNLHSKGLDSIAYDPQRFAMDYHIIGFRECAAEVARYLVTIEGMDIQDPLRLRLMSHLQYFVQQRELSVKACSSPNWSSSSYQSNCAAVTAAPPPPPPPPPPGPPSAAYHHHHHHQSYSTQSSNNSYIPNLPPPIQPYPILNPPSTTSMHQQQQQQQQHSTSRTATAATVVETSSLMSVTGHGHSEPQSHLQQQQQVGSVVGPQQQQQTQATTVAQDQQQQQQSQQQQPQQQQHYTTGDHEHHHDHHQGPATYIELTSSSHSHRNSSGNLGGYGDTSQYPTSNAQAYNTSGNVNYAGNGAKPYRPWGAEMAY